MGKIKERKRRRVKEKNPVDNHTGRWNFQNSRKGIVQLNNLLEFISVHNVAKICLLFSYCFQIKIPLGT